MLLIRWEVRWPTSSAGQHHSSFYRRGELRIVFFVGTTIMSLHYGNWSSGFLRAQYPRHVLTMPRIACSAPTDCASFPLTPTYVSVAAFPGLIWAHTMCMIQGTGMALSDV